MNKTQELLKMNCPYCGSNVELKPSTVVYDKFYGYLYICSNFPKCDSYVGTHKSNLLPLGRLANKELRVLKMKAHKYFDTIWIYRKQQGLKKARRKAYSWLSEKLNLDIDLTHIGYFDKETTEKVIKLCEPYYHKIKNKVSDFN